MARSNKNSAHEDDVGLIHGLLGKIHEMGLQGILEMVKENPEDALFLLDNRIVDRAQKYVEYNDIGPQLSEGLDTSLSKDLQAIRDMQAGKIIDFLDESERRTGGIQ